MALQSQHYFTLMIWTLLSLYAFSLETVRKEAAVTEDYCQYETFHPRCLKNEVILMSRASFGRMRIGRCITAEEVAVFGDDPRYLGCSVDVLNILDRKCSGRAECEVRHSDISLENVKPCFPGLNVYLEVSYDCISVVDEERSCSVVVSMQPVHIIGSPESKRVCGTHFQPWTLEAPVGQKIRIALLDFKVFPADQRGAGGKQSPHCQSYGVIIDPATPKSNVTICGDGREKDLHLSNENTLEVVLNSLGQKEGITNGIQFMLRVEAVGCSDLIPPEDAWLKRNDDSIVIGCYSSRQTWHLQCEGEKWIGVFGNCSQNQVIDPVAESELETENWSDEQVLTMVAVGGFTLTICLAVLCIGIVCLRRVSAKDKKNQDYKAINCNTNSSRNVHGDQEVPARLMNDFLLNDMHGSGMHQAPTYSVYVGQSDANSVQCA